MTSKLFTTLAAATTLAGIVTTAGAANAASLTQTVNYTPSDPDTEVLDGGYVRTNIKDIISVNKFDSTLGKLKSVKIDFTSSLNGDAGFENTGNSQTDMIVNLGGVLKLQLPTGIDRFVLSPQQSYTYTLPKFDKTLNFSGASGKTVDGLTASLSDTQTFTGNNFLEYFLGTGKVNFDFIATATSSVTSSGNFASYINTFAKAGVTVTYDYDPKAVPEPSAVLGIGLAGVGIFLQTKKNRLKTSNS